MPANPTDFTTSTVISASDIDTRLTAMEDYVNGNLVAGDLDGGSTWAGTQQVTRPRFVGGVNPRIMSTVSDIQYRFRGTYIQDYFLMTDDATQDWTPVFGVDIKFNPPPNQTTGMLTVLLSFDCFETGGDDPINTSGGNYTYTNTEVGSAPCAEFELNVDGVQREATNRRIYRATDEVLNYARKNHSMVWSTHNLPEGVHSAALMVKVNPASIISAGREWKLIYVGLRSMVVCVDYL